MVIEGPLPAIVSRSSRRTLVRHQANAKAFIVLIYLLVVGANAAAQIESGTVFVIGFSKNKIIMAADSREVNEGKAPLDDRCKITTLNSQFLFATTGRMFDITRGILGWDAMAQAKQAFSEASGQSRLPGRTLARDAADIWATTMSQNISANIRPQEFAGLKVRSQYVDGTFAGMADGQVQIARIIIGRAGDYPTIGSTLPEEPTISDSMQYLALGGHSRVFTEFFLATSDRARAEKRLTIRQSKK